MKTCKLFEESWRLRCYSHTLPILKIMCTCGGILLAIFWLFLWVFLVLLISPSWVWLFFDAGLSLAPLFVVMLFVHIQAYSIKAKGVVRRGFLLYLRLESYHLYTLLFSLKKCERGYCSLRVRVQSHFVRMNTFSDIGERNCFGSNSMSPLMLCSWSWYLQTLYL